MNAIAFTSVKMASSSHRHKSRTAQLRHHSSHDDYHISTHSSPFESYVLTISSSRRPLRQVVSSPRAVRAEVDAPDKGCDRILVLRGRDGWKLAEVAGVGRRFLDNRRRGVYRGAEGVWWEDVGGSIGLWMSERMPVMIVREEDCVIASWSSDGRDLARHIPGTSKSAQSSSSTRKRSSFADLEERLAEELETFANLPEILGDIVFERSVDFLFTSGDDRARIRHQDRGAILQALERNAETSRKKQRNGGHGVTYSQWADLITRLTLQQLLISSTNHTVNLDEEDPSPSKTANERSLDRVTYLGGLLLPLTVVSSILAIEGDYGPEGNNFWVFWVVSGISSLVAVGIIYIDQMRRVDVWVEAVVTGEDVLGVAEMGRSIGIANGEGELRWRKVELGWMGAMKRVSGMERLWPSEGVAFKRPAVMDRMMNV